jgi:exopolyphosphatase / guanosine-5'-triphosphate,3'-diphosphate pyrophosphatase
MTNLITKTDAPKLLAAIDVGTNSFHLVIARVHHDGRIEVMTREKELVRLGHGGGDMTALEPEAIARGVAALTRMRMLAEAAGAPVRAVATSAVREAKNASVFLRAAHDTAGVEVEVITGIEEARLIHLGVLQSLPVFDRPLLLCDIGGGSTELLCGYRGEVQGARSFKVGAVRLTDRFFADSNSANQRAKAGDVKACRDYVQSTVAPFRKLANKHPFEVAIASSGSAETVARMAHALRGQDELRTYNGFTFTVDEIEQVCDLLIETKPSDRGRLAGLDPRRADIALAGALTLHEVARSFDIKAFTISDFALREGVLLDTIARTSDEVLRHLNDISRRSVRQLMQLCDEDPTHSDHVARLALRLFDQTKALHGLDATFRDYLEAAALLANVGLFVSHSQHHIHSYYIIRNTDVLAGLTDNEIETIALVARYHRKGMPKNDHPEFGSLPTHQQRIVRLLAGLLRVAIGLDRSHDGRVGSVDVDRVGDKLVVKATSADGFPLALEVYAAQERVALLAAVLNLEVEIVAR